MKLIMAVPSLSVMSALMAQENRRMTSLDSSRTITLSQFNRLIDSCTFLLRTTPILKISDSGHIDIIKCSNTIEFAYDQLFREKRFKAARYQDFMRLLLSKKYLSKIREIYPVDKSSSIWGLLYPKPARGI
jgi:hypothetical protein